MVLRRAGRIWILISSVIFIDLAVDEAMYIHRHRDTRGNFRCLVDSRQRDGCIPRIHVA